MNERRRKDKGQVYIYIYNRYKSRCLVDDVSPHSPKNS